VIQIQGSYITADACASATATTPSRRGQQRHRNDGEDACALAAMTPSQRGQLKESIFFFFI
jgi:hypothetical protein